MSLENKHLVIVGGSSGIGLAIAKAALEAGAVVTIISRSQKKLEAANKECNGGLITHALNVNDVPSLIHTFQAIGKYDHLIVTAADLTFAPLKELSHDAILRMQESKFWGPINLIQNATSLLAENGSIVFFSGLASTRPTKGSAVISALNAGIEALTAALSIELAPIRINAISPGVVATPTWHFLPDEKRTRLMKSIAETLPVGRVGQPEDIPSAVFVLLENEWITGTTIRIDGGGSWV